MVICIGNLLSDDELAHIRDLLRDAEFVDGKLTAGWHARLVKHNTQLKGSDRAATDVRDLITTALKRNPVFQQVARPKIIRPPLISRYQVGMSYGSHVDNAIMGDASPMRTDLSLTVFLNSPTDYAGGELVIEDMQGIHPFKLDAGSMVVYPSTTLHRVEPVTQGERLVAVSWVQSLVREASDRELLFDLDTARQSLFEKYGKTPEFDLISKSHANLLRKWADL